MPSHTRPALAGLSRLTRGDVEATPDADLLGRYVAARDGEAFAELVRRHGPAVYAVCLRLTRHRADADDAFQATFLVLARKAHRVRAGEPVGAWLYGVAVRAARNVAARGWRRHARETPMAAVPDRPETESAPPDPEAAAAVLAEVSRLPAALRAAVVLCELEGRPRAAAARELGIAAGTLSSRLAGARKRLASRLAARGFGPELLVVLAGVAVSPELAAAAARLSTGPAPVGVAAVTRGVLIAMAGRKLARVGMVLSLAGTAVVAATVAWGGGPADPPAEVHPVVRRAVEPAVRPGTLVVARDADYGRFAPDGKDLGAIKPPATTLIGGSVAVSPDGTRAAVVVSSDEPPLPTREGEAPSWPFKILIRPLDGSAEPKEWKVVGRSIDARWMPDGKALAVTLTSLDGTSRSHQLLDADTGRAEPLALPADCLILDVSPDGRRFLVEQRRPNVRGLLLGLASAGDEAVTVLTALAHAKVGMAVARFSPDGATVLFTDADLSRADLYRLGHGFRPYTLSVATGRRAAVGGFPDDGCACGVAWSPDGKRVAYTWAKVPAELRAKRRLADADYDTVVDGTLTVADTDGGNAKAVATARGQLRGSPPLARVDWR